MTARSTRKTRKSSRRKTRKSNEDAGEAIAAGGFGCVFRPPIMPKSAAHRAKINAQPYISKLMKRRYAREEMEEVNRILPVVSRIPNSGRYFLLDGIFVSEDFGPLNSEDKRNFDSKCRNITRTGITSSNVNNNLHHLACMYIPDGGVSINDAMKSLSRGVSMGSSYELKAFGRLNYALVDTLKNAIVPMNKIGLIHLDLKGDNMLVSTDYMSSKKMLEVKVIDWGLAGIIPNDTSGPISAAQDRPIQFNCPPTAVLFNYNAQDSIQNYLKSVYSSTKNTFTSAVAKNMAAYIIRNSQQSMGNGHSAYVAQEVRSLTRPMINYRELEGWDVDRSCFEKDSLVQAYTVNYVAAVLEAYLKPGKYGGLTASFDAKGYFQEVYRYNVDVWGFLTAYQDLLTNVVSRSYSAYRTSTVCQLLSDVIFKYCYSPEYAAKRIPVDQLADDLLKISMAAGVPTAPARQGAAAAKKAKKKLVLRAASPAAAAATRLASVISLPPGKKRCPTGYSKDPSDPRKCRKKGTKKKQAKSPAKKAAKAKKQKSRKKTKAKAKAESPERFQANGTTYIRLPAGRKRCPAGFKKVLGPDRLAPHVRVLCEKK